MSPSETAYYNSKTVELLSVFLNLAPDFIDIKTVNEIAEDCGVSREYAMAELMGAVCGLDTTGEDRAYFRNYFLHMFHELDPKVFLANPYHKNIKISGLTKGNCTLRTQKLNPAELFVCNDFLVTEDGRMIPQIGFFPVEFEYPAVLESGREWMTLMPNETVTTDPAVEKAHGKVLTYGLGLGYFAYMASNKKEVESVAIVELSDNVISLFEECILPQFPNKEKIKIVKANAVEFAEKGGAAEFDFVFADIWHDVGDGRELYLKFKELEKMAPNAEYAYWLENTIKCYLDNSLWQ